jgi:pimeloyl-ACP methyl ester carboxylesterase
MEVNAADGIALQALVDGPADAPVTIVLLHGWTLDSRTWAPVARILADGGARVVRYDHRGHGRSAAVEPSTMTIEQLADDLRGVLAALAPGGPLVLAGHSMGGMTIMALAERHPEVLDRVAGVALVATSCGDLAEATLGLSPRRAALVRHVEHWASGSKRWASRRRLGDPRLLAPALRWLLLGRRPGREAARLTVGSIAACRPLTVSGFRPTLDAHEREAALAAFAEIPTVVLAGSRDRLTPVRHARRIADTLPGTPLTIYPEAGHMLPVERPEAVADRIAALAAAAAPVENEVPVINRPS